MTFPTPQEARKAIFAHINTVWEDKASAIIGYTPEIRWQGVPDDTLPGGDKFWMRASTQNVLTKQEGHRMPDAPDGSPVVYRTTGFVTLQMFAPKTDPEDYARGELLSEVGQCMFMATETGGSIWFRNPRINELKSDGTWYRWNVIADYQFNQTKGS